MEKLNKRKNSNDKYGSIKFKWVIITAVLTLATSAVLNLIFVSERITTKQLPVNSADILKETHKIDKEINKNGTTWLGIKATPNTEQAAPNYELWHIDDKNNKLLVANFSLSICDHINWNVNEKDGIDLLYTTSPCEAFTEDTKIIYNKQGVEQFKMIHNSSAGNFTFKQAGNYEYYVSLNIEGTCKGFMPQPPAEPSIPKVLLRGITLTNSINTNDIEEFALAKPVKISCAGGYGESIIDPIITDLIQDEEKIEFTLPNNQKAIISLKADDYAKVEFK